jgi:uncharacterized protein (DUF2336 family)
MADPAISLIDELEDALKGGSADRRIKTLRHLTDLFLRGADRLNDEQIGVFDAALVQLAQRIETKALIELSTRLAPIDNAPSEMIRSLARNDEIAVAGPILAESARLTTSDLVEIAATKGKGHLLAMSGRNKLDQTVTDALLLRSDHEVTCKLAANAGSEFSNEGFATLLKASEDDEGLAFLTGVGIDLPVRLLRELLARATAAVRHRLLAAAPVHVAREIQRALDAVGEAADREAIRPRDFAIAQRMVQLMKDKGELGESTVRDFATKGKYEEMVTAIAVMCSAPIEIIRPLMQSRRYDGLLVPCKAIDFEWPTVSAILQGRLGARTMGETDLERARSDFSKLSKASAQRLLRFWMVRETAARPSA